MKRFIISISLILMATQALAEIDFGGYYKNELIGFARRDGLFQLLDVNTVRLKFDTEFYPKVNLHIEPAYTFLIKPENLPLIDDAETDKINLDRLYVKAAFPVLDLIVGKQRIAWGTGYLWNPTDVFNPLTLSFAVAEEERRGVEAVRTLIPINSLSNVDLVIARDEETDTSRAGIRGKTNIWMYDVSLSYVSLGDEGSQVGFDSAGESFGIGLRTEVAFISPKEGDSSKKAIIGWNYSFEDGLGIDMEYLYNSIGSNTKKEYDWVNLFTGEIYTLGRNYFYLGLNKIFDEISSFNLSFLVNANDLSFLVYPSYSRNIMENLDLNIEAALTGGDKGTEFNPTETEDPSGLMNSNMYFIKVRHSF